MKLNKDGKVVNQNDEVYTWEQVQAMNPEEKAEHGRLAVRGVMEGESHDPIKLS